MDKMEAVRNILICLAGIAMSYVYDFKILGVLGILAMASIPLKFMFNKNYEGNKDKLDS